LAKRKAESALCKQQQQQQRALLCRLQLGAERISLGTSAAAHWHTVTELPCSYWRYGWQTGLPITVKIRYTR
jgi:hypothetical protein